jgi:hypothetical protein
MPAMKFKCPEEGCEKKIEGWVPEYPQHKTEHDADTACPKHKKKYEAIRKKHIKDCERLGMRP